MGIPNIKVGGRAAENNNARQSVSVLGKRTRTVREMLANYSTSMGGAKFKNMNALIKHVQNASNYKQNFEFGNLLGKYLEPIKEEQEGSVPPSLASSLRSERPSSAASNSASSLRPNLRNQERQIERQAMRQREQEEKNAHIRKVIKSISVSKRDKPFNILQKLQLNPKLLYKINIQDIYRLYGKGDKFSIGLVLGDRELPVSQFESEPGVLRSKLRRWSKYENVKKEFIKKVPTSWENVAAAISRTPEFRGHTITPALLKNTFTNYRNKNYKQFVEGKLKYTIPRVNLRGSKSRETTLVGKNYQLRSGTNISRPRGTSPATKPTPNRKAYGVGPSPAAKGAARQRAVQIALGTGTGRRANGRGGSQLV